MCPTVELSRGHVQYPIQQRTIHDMTTSRGVPADTRRLSDRIIIFHLETPFDRGLKTHYSIIVLFGTLT